MGNNIKLGVGYNFTDFSDDVTDLDYNSKGVFVNLVGKMERRCVLAFRAERTGGRFFTKRRND